jgi:hypothetical protein
MRNDFKSIKYKTLLVFLATLEFSIPGGLNLCGRDGVQVNARKSMTGPAGRASPELLEEMQFIFYLVASFAPCFATFYLSLFISSYRFAKSIFISIELDFTQPIRKLAQTWIEQHSLPRGVLGRY